MPIKKSDLYASLWASCDQLRSAGGMDTSLDKDYVLFMLFIKYISDKYGHSDDFAPPVTIPVGSSFKDMIGVKGKRASVLGIRPDNTVAATTAYDPTFGSGSLLLKVAARVQEHLRKMGAVWN